MVTLRKILFYFFVTLYLVVCPLIILYALGYIFTPKVEEGFAKTGLMHFETLPAGASISIAKKGYAEKTPATVRNLLAGVYDVNISRTGYRSWTRRIRITPGKAVAFDKILLMPHEVKVKTLIPQTFEDLLSVPETHFLLLFKTKKAGDLSVFDWKDEISRPLLTEGTPFQEALVIRSFVIRKSSFVLLLVKMGEQMRFLGCHLDKEKPEVKDLSDLFVRGEPSDVRWESDNPENLFVLYGEELDRLDLKKMQVHTGLLKSIQGFDLFKGKVFALRNFTLVQMDCNGEKGEEVLVEKGIFLENLFRNTGVFKMDFISGRTLCFLGANGEFFANELPYRFVGEGLKGYQPDPGGRKIVLWQKERLGVLDFTKVTRRKELFERGPEIDWIFEKGEDLLQAYFVYGTSHVLFRNKNEVFLAPVGESGALMEKLVKVHVGSSVFYSEKTGRLYYLDPAQGHLLAADILPEWPGLSGMFTEFEGQSQEVVK